MSRIRFTIFAAMVSLPTLAIAQTSVTPLPAVPFVEPLHAGRPAALPAPALPVFAAPAAAVAVVTLPVVAAPVVASRLEAPVAGAVLPTNTDVLVRLDQPVTSKGGKVGDTFKMTVVQDVMLGGLIVIPRGTPAFGQIAWRTGKGMFGKSAKMEITIDQVELNGRAVPLSGRFRAEGDGNTGATIGVGLAAGLIGAAFVTGRSAVFEAGREFRVATREALPLEMPRSPLVSMSQAGLAGTPTR